MSKRWSATHEIEVAIENAAKAIHNVDRYAESRHSLVQIPLRTAVGEQSTESLLEQRGKVGEKSLKIVDDAANRFGLSLSATDVKDIMFSGEFERLFAEVVKAQKEGKAALTRVRGESTTLRNLANTAGKTMGNTFVLGLPNNLTVARRDKSGSS